MKKTCKENKLFCLHYTPPRWWFTETDVKHFKIVALRKITNITRSIVN